VTQNKIQLGRSQNNCLDVLPNSQKKYWYRRENCLDKVPNSHRIKITKNLSMQLLKRRKNMILFILISY